jgi:hypothetical protein
MDGPDDLRELAMRRENLIATNRVLFDGHPEAAYHALEAALHCAIDEEDVPALRGIAAIASEQHRHAAQRCVAAATPARPVVVGHLPDVGALTRWGSLERLYGAVEHQANVKASTIELQRAQEAHRAAW